MKIRIDLKIFIFALIFVITHQIKIYGIVMLFAFIHELGHLFVGLLMGFKIEKLEITPYGLAIGFNIECKDLNKKIKKANALALKKLIIASAGPITNIIIVIVSLFFDMHVGIDRSLIIYSNLLIAIFNLIPIYPLDGGRILKEVLHIFFGLKRCYKYTNLISNITICFLTFVCSVSIFFIRNIALLIVLFYLWYLALKENKKYKQWKQIYDRIQTAPIL